MRWQREAQTPATVSGNTAESQARTRKIALWKNTGLF